MGKSVRKAHRSGYSATRVSSERRNFLETCFKGPAQQTRLLVDRQTPPRRSYLGSYVGAVVPRAGGNGPGIPHHSLLVRARPALQSFSWLIKCLNCFFVPGI